MGIAENVKKQAKKPILGHLPLVHADAIKAASEKSDIDSSSATLVRYQKDGLDLGVSWAIIGTFSILALSVVYFMSSILIPITLAIVVGMILGMAAEKLAKLGVPRVLNAILLSGAVALVLFLIVNGLVQPVNMLLTDGPGFVERSLDRLIPILQQYQWLHITPDTFKSGPMSMDALLENTGNVLHMVSANLTPALIQGLIFFGALLFFLVGRVNIRRSLIMMSQNRERRLTTIRLFTAAERALGFYFGTASILYAGLGLAMMLIAYLGDLGSPFLWGFFAFLSSFIPYLGITVMTLSIAGAGILTHDNFWIALTPAACFFVCHLIMENLLFPAVMGRRLEMNPFVVFLAILFWTWMWGAAGAMLALPLSLIVMAIIEELFVESKIQPQLP